METLAAEVKQLGQTVLVLQGGGALGAYQLGVYQAFHEAGLEPDWVFSTSIGAINASLIVGNAPNERMNKLQEFWKRVELADYAWRLFLRRPTWSCATLSPLPPACRTSSSKSCSLCKSAHASRTGTSRLLFGRAVH